MKQLYIIKTGTTFAAAAKRLGDFDAWTIAALGKMRVDIQVIDVEHGELFPRPEDTAGALITGSHAMVTDKLPWRANAEIWIRELLEARTPLLGICFGHQLLAQAAGGHVDFHPRGKEIGTVPVHRLSNRVNDTLFHTLPQSFFVHTSHAQSVLRLPPDAIRLAANDHDPNHAFRLGDCAWGVQFHPEYNANIMRAYIAAQADELKLAGQNVTKLMNGVVETPIAAQVLRNFARIVEN